MTVNVVQITIVRVSKNGRKQQLTTSVRCKVRLVRQATRPVNVVHRRTAHEQRTSFVLLLSPLQSLVDVGGGGGVRGTLEASSGHGRCKVRNLRHWQLVL